MTQVILIQELGWLSVTFLICIIISVTSEAINILLCVFYMLYKVRN